MSDPNLTARIEALETTMIELMAALAAQDDSLRREIMRRLQDAATDAGDMGDDLVKGAISSIAVSLQNHV